METAYALLELLHSDSQGEVWRATRAADQTSVVLKFVNAANVSGAAQRLRREYRLIRQLKSPHIVACLGMDSLQGRPMLVFEDLHAVSLRIHCRGGPLPWQTLLGIAPRMALALADMHDAGILHKDVTPDNFIWNAEADALRLVDCSIAAPLQGESATPLQVFEGNPAYVSPEQTGMLRCGLDTRADLYSLGATFYELLAGRPPFECEDLHACLHSHLAVAPAPLERRVPDVPPVLAAIVHKLLEKEPEARYQSARGLAADLEQLRSLHAARRLPSDHPDALPSAMPETMALGTRDFTGRLDLAATLHGRGAERDRLLAVLEQARQGASAAVLVSGAPGIGKSRLVLELTGPLAREGGLFIAGKCEQLQRGEPYHPLIQAMGELGQQFLARDAQAVAGWRTRLKERMGQGIGFLTTIMPALETLLGETFETPAIPFPESRQHLIQALLTFLGEVCTLDRPLVLFLDDMQWCDAATLVLLEAVLRRPPGHFLCVLACRDADAEALRPVETLLATAQAGDARTLRLDLGPLGGQASRDLVGQALGRPVMEGEDDVDALAGLLDVHTGGNPFHLQQLLLKLVADGLLWPDRKAGRWRWDLSRIKELTPTEDVAVLVTARLRDLPADTQQILGLAACLGSRFEVAALARVAGIQEDACLDRLAPAVEQGLLVPLTESTGTGLWFSGCRFLHDRVEQAAYGLLDENQQARTHRAVGRGLLESLSEKALQPRLFEVVSQLNRGVSVIEDAGERLELAALNVRAAVRARLTDAYSLGLRRLDQAQALLFDEAQADPWDQHYALCFELHKERATALSRTARHAEAEACLEAAIPRCRSALDTVALLGVRIEMQMQRGALPASRATGLEALALLGFDLRSVDFQTENEALRQWLLEYFATHPVEDAADWPLSTDPRIAAAVGMVAALAPTAYFLDPGLWRHLFMIVVRMSIEHGLTEDTYGAYLCMARILLMDRQDLDQAMRFGRTGVRMAERLAKASQNYVARSMHVFYVMHWSDPYATVIERIRELMVVGRAGDMYFYLSFLSMLDIIMRIMSGQALPIMMQHIQETLRELASNELPFLRLVVLSKVFFIRCMFNASDDGAYDIEEQTETEFLATCQTMHNDFAMFCFGVWKALAMHLCGDRDAALEAIALSEQRLETSRNTPQEAELTFVRACVLASAERLDGEELARLQEDAVRLERWSGWCAENFLAKCRLVQAERARLAGDVQTAMDCYDQAIAAGGEHGQVYVEAMACERAGRFWLGLHRPVVAAPYLRAAAAAYARWGAARKVRTMEQECAPLLEAGSEEFVQDGTRIISVASLGVQALLRAGQVIATELDFDRLQERLLGVLVEHAGASRGALLLCQDEDCDVALLLDEHGEFVRSACPDNRLEACATLPASVLRYAVRSGESLRLSDPAEDRRFSRDAYLDRVRPRSILCLPIVSQGGMQALAYLENTFIPQAFSERIQSALTLLAPQAAIALDNARLFREQTRAEAQVRLLSQELIQAHERERSRIARELHDHVAQNLLALKLQCELSLRYGDSHPLEAMLAVLQDTLTTVRGICYELLPPSLESLGLAGAVLQYCDELRQTHGLSIEADVGALDAQAFSPRAQLNCYRIIQESLRNAATHAGARLVSVTARACDGPGLRVEIVDDGRGFDVARRLEACVREKRFGLASLRQRAALLGGALEIRSSPGEGTRIELVLPQQGAEGGSPSRASQDRTA